VKETHLRSVVKAISWRLSASLVTLIIVYLVTGKINFALYIGAFEFFFKVLFFYLHERIWGLIHFGRPNYQSKQQV